MKSDNVKVGMQQAPHRSLFNALGMTEEEMKKQVEELVNLLHQSHYNLNEYQMVIMEIAFAFSRFYKKYHIVSDSEFEGSKKMAVTILSLTSGEELDQWLLDYCQLIRLLVQKKRVDNNVILVGNAKKKQKKTFLIRI